MKKREVLVIVISFIGFILYFSGCAFYVESKPESDFLKYCGDCHLAPDPGSLSKSVWEEDVLPDMALRLGYSCSDYNPFDNKSMLEQSLIRRTNAYPTRPLIDSMTWDRIHAYIVSRAPEALPVNAPNREDRNKELVQFTPSLHSIGGSRLPGITSLSFSEECSGLSIGDSNGQIYDWPGATPESLQFNSPVISFLCQDQDSFFTEIGYMHPSENPLGSLYKVGSRQVDTIVTKLHRPVFTKVIDLNDDGESEFLICEFGNLDGALSLVTYEDDKFEKRKLLPLAGTIKAEVVDMDKDGMKDIVVLTSQGNEGIFILYQKRGFQFKYEQVIQLPPEFGTSWFELVDYNDDDYMDIILANGDNLDFSPILKPYHGVRIFINSGNDRFVEEWFYPIYGATRVLAEDFDQDGDLDIAVSSYFPDFDATLSESFVYLENKEAEKYLFNTFTTPMATEGRWLVMEKGDYDEDGDVDLMLGAFFLESEVDDKALLERWADNKYDLLLLENNAAD